MLDNLEPLRWHEILEKRPREELPFVHYFEEVQPQPVPMGDSL
jgi:hypothetical protein